jgi:lipoprotein-anchoring transpeptidase ErfK/SrfK
MKTIHFVRAAAPAIALAACIVTEKSQKTDTTAAAVDTGAAANYVADSVISVPYDSIASDTAGLGAQIGNTAPLANDTAFTRITGQSTGGALTKFPAKIPTRGALPLQLEILLDRAGFSPGIIDGTWGANAAKALAWFKVANGMDSTGASGMSDTTAMTDTTSAKTKTAKKTTSKQTTPKQTTTANAKLASLDQATYQKLVQAGQSTPLITTYQVTADDVKGPFVQVPDNVYQQAKLDCLCYSSPGEALAEKFHTSEQMLKQLNPKIDFKTIAAGTSIQVPNVAQISPPTGGGVAKLVISKKGYWTHAVDASGKVIAHFPSTLGAGYDPSPTGDFKVTGISRNPSFNYQPTLMAEVPDTKPTAKLKPGPNSPVGVVWMSLSKPHYGIHGTAHPETIGYANSHGCVRLTNWDAEELASMIKAGIPVQFE